MKSNYLKLHNLLMLGVRALFYLATIPLIVGLSINPAEARPFAYVTNHLTGTISVIDTNPTSPNFNKVVSTIPVGGDPDVVVSVPDGSLAYVTSRNTGTITVIDTNPRSSFFNTVISTIQVEGNPGMIAITPDGNRAYVTNRSSKTISVIDTNPNSSEFNQVVRTIAMPKPLDWIAITPNGTRAYVTSRSSATVMVIDIKPGSSTFHKLVDSQVVGGDPNTIGFTPDGSRAYIVSSLTHSISVMDIDPSSPNYNQVVSIVGPCSLPSGFVFTPDGNHGYMTNHGSGTVSLIGTNPNHNDFNKVKPILHVGQNPDAIAITPDGSHIYVITDDQSVVVIDTSTNSIINTLPFDNGLSWVAVVPSPNLPANLPPVADAGGPYKVDEGESVQLTGTATDPDYDPLTFAWDLDKDGTFDTTSPSLTFIAAGIDGPSVRTVVLKVTDSGGLSDTSEATITINNVPPTLVSVANDSPVNEGSLVRVTAAATDFRLDTLTYLFDFDMDGVFEVNQDSPAATHIYPGTGSFTVPVQVRDDDGGLSNILTTVVVVNNAPPKAHAGLDRSANEGSAITFTGSFTDSDAGTHTFSWNFGDGSPAVTGTLMPEHIYKDNGTFNATLTVTDDEGAVGSDTMTVTVENVAPTTDAGSDRTLNEGDTMGLVSVTFTDPGIQDTHTATIDWKDGSPVESSVAKEGKVSGTHVYTDNGVFAVEICVSDDDGGVGCDSFQVTVNNVAPTVNAGIDQTIPEGSPITFKGSFSDPGADTHTYSWHFGDGSPAVTNSLAPWHTYKDNGTFTVTLTVTDDDGGSDTDTAIVTVKNQPPVISVPYGVAVDEGMPLELTLSASDVGELDLVSLEVSGLPNGASFSPTAGNPASGTMKWTPAFTQSGSYPGLTFTATDNDGAKDTRTVNLTVNEKGQPVLAVTNLVDDTVTLIDQQVNGVISTVNVGHHPVAAAFHSFYVDGLKPLAKLYVAERNDDSLSVLAPTSTSTLALSKVIPVGNKPKGVGVSPQGTEVWVANRNGDSLSIIDPATDAIMATVPLGLKGSSKGKGGSDKDDRKSVAIGFSPDDLYAYVVARNSGTLMIVDKARALVDSTNAIVASVEVGNMPEALAVDPAGGLVYVANWNGRNVSVVDVSSPALPVVLTTVEVGKHPEGMALLSDGSKLYVTNRDSGTVSVFEVGTYPTYLTLTKTIAVGKKPLGIAATRGGSFISGDYVYVANRIDDTVSVIDAVTDQVIATIPVGKHPSGVAAGIMPTIP